MLERKGSWELPLEEASALTLRRDPVTAAVELVAVDDERYSVARAAMAAGRVSPQSEPDELRDAVVAAGADRVQGSDFEGVASDAGGRLFVLQEGADRILVLNPELDAVTRTITLTVDPDEPDLGQEWHADDNSRGEGLLLLRNGHVIVAKQREEPRLIEFGPPGDAEGFTPGDALSTDETFPLPAEILAFRVLRSWRLAAGSPLESINDIAVDAQGHLHIVSSKSRCLARLTVDLEPHGGTAAFAAWPLPDVMFSDENDKAEGLVYAPGVGWLVALDLERRAPNLFHITGVP